MPAPALGKVEKLIVDAIRKSKKPMSTYEIAKSVSISWSTANIHCYKMKSFGVLDCREEEAKIGVKRIVWWIK